MITWLQHVEKWKDCTKCPLAQQRSNIVLARGTVPCDVLFIGEAPGQSEDAIGQPFVGPAGLLLDNPSLEHPGIVQHALPCHKEWVSDPTYKHGTIERWVMDLRVAFTNLVACFPAEAKARGDNEPELAEIRACRPRLEEFIALAQPRLVVRVGSLASDYAQHDSYGRIQGAEVIDIVHPANILRMPLAQKQMAVQRVIVVIKNAVERMLQ